MIPNKFFGGGTLGRVAMAMILSVGLFTITGCGGGDSKGLKKSRWDTEVARRAQADTAPQAGQATCTVHLTLTYRNKTWGGTVTDYEAIDPTQYTAEYQDLLQCWMAKIDGKFYRFDTGKTAGAEIAKPQPNLGDKAAKVSANDSESLRVDSLTAAPVDTLVGADREVTAAYECINSTTYYDAHYRIERKHTAEYVKQLDQHMIWLKGREFSIDHNGKFTELSDRPMVHIGGRDDTISSADTFVTNSRIVSFDSGSAKFSVERQYDHTSTYIVERYSVKQSKTGDYIPEVGAYQTKIDKDIYQATSSHDLKVVPSTVHVGLRVLKLSWADSVIRREVVPVKLSANGDAILVDITRTYEHQTKYQSLRYDIGDSGVAKYRNLNGTDAWVIDVDGRLYVITFGGNINDPNITNVQAPNGFQKPKVIVNPSNGNGSNPPVVVPKPPKGNQDNPPVVIPGNPVNNNPPANTDNPPVVIPGVK